MRKKKFNTLLFLCDAAAGSAAVLPASILVFSAEPALAFTLISPLHLLVTFTVFTAVLLMARTPYRSAVYADDLCAPSILKKIFIQYSLALGISGLILHFSELYFSPVFAALMFFFGATGIYFLRRQYCLRVSDTHINSTRRILLIGAGEAGRSILSEMAHTGESEAVLGILDDDESKKGTSIFNIEVIGQIADLPELCRKIQINEIIIGIGEMSADKLNEIIDSIDTKKVRLRIVPAKNENVSERIRLDSIRTIFAEDLLGRRPVRLNSSLIKQEFSGRTIFITGAGGSIGSELCLQTLKFPIKRLICFCRSEFSQYNLQEKLTRENTNAREIKYYLGDIRDFDRLHEIFSGEKPDMIFHAAAHKHVPFMETNEKESIKNNVFGTENVLKAAYTCGIKKFILVSTDKAVNPTNVMGASKRLAELMTGLFNEQKGLDTAIVRFGNVLGSRGSVVPLFRKQILSGGPISVTHPEVVRYFMTINEAALLVINCAALSKGGERFLLDMGEPIKINNLVKKMIRIYGYEPGKDIKIIYTGLRPGEKLYEELLTKSEATEATANSKIFVCKDKHTTRGDFPAWIDHMHRSLSAMSPAEVRSEIKSMVPEFVSSL